MERSLRVRFEQKRGHYLVVEGDPPFTREACDAFQVNMLRACEIPGLLKLEASETDGIVSLRYPITGLRMLSQAQRAGTWTTADFMAALCRLAEAREECRLHVLDPARIVLDEDWIFLGEGTADLRFAYLPVAVPGVPGMDETSLLVRWMSRVPDMDGDTMRKVLRLASSPGDAPADWRRFARAYLSSSAVPRDTGGDSRPESVGAAGIGAAGMGAQGGLGLSGGGGTDAAAEIRREESASEPEARLASGPSPGWRWFQPPREPHSLSSLLGEGRVHVEDAGPVHRRKESPGETRNPRDTSKTRIGLICGAVLLTAMVWKAGYARDPSTVGLGISAGGTLAVAVSAWRLWIRVKESGSHDADGDGYAQDAGAAQAAYAPGRADGDDGYAARILYLMPDGEDRELRSDGVRPFAGTARGADAMMDTVGMANEAERTQELRAMQAERAAAGSLEWMSGAAPLSVPLDVESLVIGRSREAADHVDTSTGVSRTHVELRRTRDGWTVKDLGSRNGTRLNDAPLVPYQAYPLQPGDRLDLAGSRYRYLAG